MSKPAPNKDLKPKDEENKSSGGFKLQMDTNLLLVINTAVLIVFFIIFSLIGNSIIKSTVQSELQKFKPTDEIAVEESEDTVTDEKGILLDLGDFILNLADTNARRYLKVNIAIELSKTEDELKALTEAAEAPAAGGHGGHGAAAPADPMAAVVLEMEQYKPAIRDAVISVLSSKTADELSSVTGKEIAKEEIQDLVSSIFNGTRDVLRVNFAQFIIQ